jgi:hypothetical protein
MYLLGEMAVLEQQVELVDDDSGKLCWQPTSLEGAA